MFRRFKSIFVSLAWCITVSNSEQSRYRITARVVGATTTTASVWCSAFFCLATIATTATTLTRQLHHCPRRPPMRTILGCHVIEDDQTCDRHMPSQNYNILSWPTAPAPPPPPASGFPFPPMLPLVAVERAD